MNTVTYYNANHHKVGEVECPNFQLSIRFVVENSFKFSDAKYALYLSGDESKEFHLYEISERGIEYSCKLVLMTDDGGEEPPF